LRLSPDLAGPHSSPALRQRSGAEPARLEKEIYGHIANRLQAAVFREAVSLLDGGVASLADIDPAMSDGPGLRWALMGPFLTFHLAGGSGGMAGFMQQFAPMQAAARRDLGEPVLNARLQEVVSRAMAAEVAGQSGDELAAERDRLILSLLSARAKTARPV
jgi:3-hydroxyacyl-CoA dehydrogenase